MKFLRARVRVRRRDEGAILIIAIVIIAVVALVTGAVLTRGESSIRTTIALRGVAGNTYAADAAAQVALNALRTGYWHGDETYKPENWAFNNADYDGCFGRHVVDETLSELEPISDIELAEFYPASKSSGEGPTSAWVHCVAESFTGSQGTEGGVGGGNALNHAFFGTGEAETYGLQTTTNGNPSMPLSIDGPIQVNSPTNSSGKDAIEVKSGDADVAGPDANNCKGLGINVATGYDRNCNASVKTKPNLTHEAMPELELQTPRTTCSGGVMVFDPGYYDDVRLLNTATGRCALAWFRPGTYYFDFHNDQTSVGGVLNDPLAGAGMTGASRSNVWEIDSKVVAGAWSGGAGAPPSNVAVPGACVDPRVTTTPGLGVQFIFGGDSRMLIDSDATVEICGSYSPGRPPIALYGFQGTTEPVATEVSDLDGLTTDADATVTAAGTHGTFVGGTQAALQGAGNGTAVWTRTTGNQGAQTRSLSLSGFQTAPAVPRGSVLTGASVVVRHRTTGTANAAATVTVTPNGLSAFPAISLGRPGALTVETIDLRAQLSTASWNSLAQRFHDGTYTGATIAYGATLPTGSAENPQEAEVDFVRLELEYYLPQMRGVSAIANNCVPMVGGCDQIESSTNGKGSMLIQGTTYLPDGRIDVRIKNDDVGWRFGWGLVARAFAYDSNGASADVQEAIIDLPDVNPGSIGQRGTNVRITVYLCEGQSTCDAASGKKALNVRAQLWDEDPENVVPGARAVNVLSWSHTR